MTSARIKKIREVTGLKIDSYKVVDRSSESMIIEVNQKWIFRFPRNSVFRKKMEKRLNFLASFSKVSPLKVPVPEYIDHDFIGYKKIPGRHLYRTNIEKLSRKDRTRIARQLGQFLRALHSFKKSAVNFDTGYLIMKKGDYKSLPDLLTKHLNAAECNVLSTKLTAIANNPRNFEKPSAIIHGDLHFNNILWDPKKKIITGILDWAEVGLGIPAMDFIGLADFSKKTNDQFLRDILTYYGAKNDDLFNQIKENYIIDVMNWFWWYEKNHQPKGMARIIKRLKRLLEVG